MMRHVFARLPALALALTLILGLAACSPAREPSSTGAPTEGPTQSPAPTGTEIPTAVPTEGPAEGPQGQAFRLGGIAPLGGESARLGAAAMTGARIAVEEINALGGIRFEFDDRDDRDDAEIALGAYGALREWGMQLLVGCATDGPCAAMADQTANDRLFAMTPSASSGQAAGDCLYQMCLSDAGEGAAAAEYVSARFPNARIAAVYQGDDPAATAVWEGFAAKLRDSVIYDGPFTADTRDDLTVQMLTAQAVGADVVYLPVDARTAAAALACARQIGYAPAFVCGADADGLLSLEGFDTGLAEGVTVLSAFSPWAEDERTARFVSRYRELTGGLPNQTAAAGYDCVYAIYEGLRAAGCTADQSPEELCAALTGLFSSGGFSFSGLTGADQTWTASGRLVRAPAAFVIKDGEYTAP